MDELTDSQFLLDLAKRLWTIPVKYGTDQCDIERLEEIAAKCGREKTFVLHWLDGTDITITGTDIHDAFCRAGFGAGAMPALDYFEEVPNETT